jgi:predicted small metal-binding protein
VRGSVTRKEKKMAKVIDCTAPGHASGMQVRGETEDELVKAGEAHVKQYHPAMKITREQLIGMAKDR